MRFDKTISNKFDCFALNFYVVLQVFGGIFIVKKA